MMRLMASLFVTGQALVFFLEKMQDQNFTADGAISALERHFLDKLERRVNMEVLE